ncbi:MAG: hypothetical protein IH936_12680 [Acidobacteria bacterium]|nr:hypothetical protein [Acidobacteriota bacterium]
MRSEARRRGDVDDCLIAAVLWASMALGSLSASASEPIPESNAGTDAPIDFATALAALDAGESRLAADLLGALRDRSDGLERRYYTALVLAAGGRSSEVRAEMEAIASDSSEDSLPDWLWSDLVRRLAGHRLAERQAEAERQLEAVLARHYEARGGVEHLRSLSDMVVHGTVRSENGRLRFRLIRKRPRFYRLDFEGADGGRSIEAVDGQVAWRLRPPYRPEDGTFLDGDERRKWLDDSHFNDVLLRYRETGERLYLAGSETVAGHETDRIEVDSPSGKRITVFLDRETGLEVRRLVWGEPGEPPITITVEQGNFDGRALPARQIVESPNGVLEYIFAGYNFDPTLDPAAFDLESVRRVEAARLAAAAAEETEVTGAGGAGEAAEAADTGATHRTSTTGR